MKEIYCLIDLFKKAIKHKSILFLFPFTIVAAAIGLVYLIVGCVYMLMDLVCIELRKELNRGNDSAGVLANGFKYLIAYSVYITFEISRIMVLMNLAILYFFTYLFVFVATLGRIKEGPFAFHKLNEVEENSK